MFYMQIIHVQFSSYFEGPKVPVAVVAVMSGLVIVILCIFIFLLVRGYHTHRRNKKLKSEKEDEYSLLSENIDYVSFQ